MRVRVGVRVRVASTRVRVRVSVEHEEAAAVERDHATRHEVLQSPQGRHHQVGTWGVKQRTVLEAPGVPRYAVRTVRPRLVRVPSTYSTRGPGGKPPCASGTYPTREAGTRSLYVPNGGPGAYASARGSAQRERARLEGLG